MTSVACQARAEKPSAAARYGLRAPLGSPAVIVVGGGANALSIARSLGRRGVDVFAINEPGAYVRYSRYARWIRAAGHSAASWADWLTGGQSDPWRGSLLLAASDGAIKLMIEHREVLEKRFVLDISHSAAQAAMLNKLSTYRAAVAAGVPTPRFWVAGNLDQIQAIRRELVYPLLVKPEVSHLFEARFGKKFLLAHTYEELTNAFRAVRDEKIDVLLVERIEGPDSRLCSYYTYLDEAGVPVFDFTKRIIRRWPVGMGGACYHVVDDVPEVRELGLRLFRHVGLRGLANVEFKLDPRDGQLKLIECNARFTAANGLLMDCGLDLAAFVYDRLTGREPAAIGPARKGLRLWYPWEDFKAFCQLRRSGEMKLSEWLLSLCHRQTFPFFRLSDPWPTIVAESRRLIRFAGRRARQARKLL